MQADADKLTGADAAALSLDFLRSHYSTQLAYSATRVLADPWALFAQPFVHAALTHVALCDTADAPHALYAALTLAAAHGGAAAVCVGAGEERATVLAKTRPQAGRAPTGRTFSGPRKQKTRARALAHAMLYWLSFILVGYKQNFVRLVSHVF